MDAAATTAVVEALYTAYNSHRTSDVAALYTDEGIHEDIAHGRPKVGAQTIAAGLEKFLGWFPDAEWKPGSIIADNEGRAAVQYTLTATLCAALGPVPPRGQKIFLRGLMVLTLENGKIVRSEDYWDATTFQKQLDSNAPEERP
ncbi:MULTISPECIES: nuclear transport factor 2 family protein [unclassified Ensifer]|uniref:nuclear transport factor 2 family protein n=1 Tax=unclassified Ensifer TaxID=2633371 RepID=UPI001FEFB610|nr:MULTISPECIES: ester cyclase [unclassified Ensifer]